MDQQLSTELLVGSWRTQWPPVRHWTCHVHSPDGSTFLSSDHISVMVNVWELFCIHCVNELNSRNGSATMTML